MNRFRGLIIEHEIANSLNNKKLSELSNNLKNLVTTIIRDTNANSEIKAFTFDNRGKPDIKIICNGQEKNVSIKSGSAEILHNEIFQNFLAFLKENGISDETLDTLRLYHYGDGTLDGSGQCRMNYNEVMVTYEDRIKKANYELNGNRDLVKKIVERCIFDGTLPDCEVADCLYVGELDYGVIVTRKQIESHILRKYYSYYNCPHIGPLLLRPDSRYAGREILDERKRNRIIVHWPGLRREIEYISNRYNY